MWWAFLFPILLLWINITNIEILRLFYVTNWYRLSDWNTLNEQLNYLNISPNLCGHWAVKYQTLYSRIPLTRMVSPRETYRGMGINLWALHQRYNAVRNMRVEAGPEPLTNYMDVSTWQQILARNIYFLNTEINIGSPIYIVRYEIIDPLT